MLSSSTTITDSSGSLTANIGSLTANFGSLTDGFVPPSNAFNAVQFDGTNDYLFNSGSSITDTQIFLAAFAINLQNGGFIKKHLFQWGKYLDAFSDPYPFMEIYFTSNGVSSGNFNIKMNVFPGQLSFIPPGDALATIDITGLARDQWHEILCYIDVNNGEVVAYDNDVQIPQTPIGIGNTCFVSFDDEYWAVVGGYTTDGVNFSSQFLGGVCELFIQREVPFDLSVAANRRKFFTALGAPVDKGTNGSLATGTQPDYYFKNPAASYGTNSGSQGNLTLTGTLVDIAPPP